MSQVRTPKDEDEKRRIKDAIQRGLGVPLGAFIQAIIGREPEASLVEAIQLGIESHKSMPDQNTPLDMKAYVLQHVKWLESNS